MNDYNPLKRFQNKNGFGFEKTYPTITLFNKPLTKERIFNMYWLWDARQGRGSGYLNELRLTTYIPVVGVILLLFPQIPKWTLPFFIVGFFIGTYLIGYIDEKHIKYWHFDAEKSATYNFNPQERRKERRLMRIEKALGVESEQTPFDISETEFEKEVKENKENGKRV